MYDEPTQEQWMTAILAVNKLREDPNRDQIVRDYIKSLPKKSGDYSAWEYVTKDSNHDNHTPFHAAYCSLYQTSLIKSKLWETHLTPAEKKLIKKVAMSYTATSERETWFFGYGKGHYAVNSDEIPDGIPLNPYKQRHLNHIVGQVRALREVYWKDPLIKEVTTNILAGLILVDGE